jgi:chemotaxis protein methyltransferase CheR
MDEHESTTEQRGFLTGFAKPMSRAEFSRFSEFIGTQCGIKMPNSKKIMLEARLQKRLRILGIRTFGEYFSYIHSEDGQSELVHMLDAVTTNKTDFFREPAHFDILARTILPEFHAEQSERPFYVWSAGCATGEEPYTLAMVLTDFAERHPPFRFSVLATDISTRALDRAREAIYDGERVATITQAMKQKYVLRSKDRSKKIVRMTPAIRSAVQFRRLNLMEEAFAFTEPLDAIFCRNVIIYFDRTTQERLIDRFCRVLRPGGYLFLGHSESIHGFSLPLRRVVSTVYRSTG